MKKSYWQSPSFWYGIYYGLGMFVLSLIIYLIDINLTLAAWYRFLTILAIPVFVMVLSSLHQAKWLGEDTYPYKKAFLSAFLTGVIGTLLMTIINFVYIQIDPQFLETIKELSREQQIEKFREMGQSQEQIDASLEQGEKFMKKMGGYAGFMAIFQIFSILLQAIYAAIVAIFTRKKGPQQADVI